MNHEMTEQERVYSLHHEGLDVYEIAEKMRMEPDWVRAYIVQSWKDDKERNKRKSASK